MPESKQAKQPRDYAVALIDGNGQVVSVASRGMTLKDAERERKRIKREMVRPAILPPGHAALEAAAAD